MKPILFLLALVLLAGCHRHDEKFVFVNNTANTIDIVLMPDTSFNIMKSKSSYNIVLRVSPFSQVRPHYGTGHGEKLEELIPDGLNGKMYLCIFRENSFSLETIKNKDYKRFSFSVEDLDRTNWTFNYYDEK